MSFPYALRRRDDIAARELKVGHIVAFAAKSLAYYKVTGKRLWRTEPKTVTCQIAGNLTVDFANTPNNNITTPPGIVPSVTTGQCRYGGYSGDLARTILRQFKYIALASPAPLNEANIEIYWGREPYPKDATALFNSVTLPLTAPMTFDRWSYDPAMYLSFIIRLPLILVSSWIHLEMVEYDIKALKTGDMEKGDYFCFIDPSGYLTEPIKYEG